MTATFVPQSPHRTYSQFALPLSNGTAAAAAATAAAAVEAAEVLRLFGLAWHRWKGDSPLRCVLWLGVPPP